MFEEAEANVGTLAGRYVCRDKKNMQKFFCNVPVCVISLSFDSNCQNCFK